MLLREDVSGLSEQPDFNYLPAATYFPSKTFNAKILWACKTVYAEALLTLYGRNTFVVRAQPTHLDLLTNRFLPRAQTTHLDLFTGLAGRPLAYLEYLRVNLFQMNAIFEGGSTSMRYKLIHGAGALETITLACDTNREWQEEGVVSASLVRIAANIANVKKGTAEPRLVTKFQMNPVRPFYFSSGSCRSRSASEPIEKKPVEKDGDASWTDN